MFDYEFIRLKHTWFSRLLLLTFIKNVIRITRSIYIGCNLLFKDSHNESCVFSFQIKENFALISFEYF
jgi:hypothetical protein